MSTANTASELRRMHEHTARAGVPGRGFRALGMVAFRVLGAAAAVMLLLGGEPADARLVTVSWTDPNPAPSPVTGFRLHVGTSSRSYGAIVQLGLPTPGAGGVYSASANVPDNVTVYMAMTAFEVTGLESTLSNEQVLAAPPPPPPVDQLPDGRIDAPAGNVTIQQGQSVTFAGSGSDPDGGSVTYRWDFDAVGSGIQPSTNEDPGARTFTLAGTFLVSLTVTDDEGNADPTPATRTITVQAVAPPPPTGTGGSTAGFSGLRSAGRVTANAVVATAPDGDPRLFVAERSGLIRIVEGGYPRRALFLDLGDDVSYDLGGLLGLAFSPGYSSNGYLFVSRVDARGDFVLARFRRGEHDYVADRASELELLRVALPGGANAGGGLAFDANGMLFVGLGDGGGAGDPGDLAQDPGVLQGKLLRLDVGVPANAQSRPAGLYAIPADNPFLNVSGTRPEIWATGVRDPAQLSVDRMNGALWIADRGAGARDEIDYESGSDAGGRNYGWDVAEGTLCNAVDPSPALACDDTSISDPVFEYAPGSAGCGIVGGYAYRGVQPTLQGEYFFADACSGNVYSLQRTTGRLTQRTLQFVADGKSNVRAIALGEGGTGELYVIGADGQTWEIRSDLPSCRDGVDNDGDGLIDFPTDPGCASRDSEVEGPLCDDGFDNDLDGTSDRGDAQCTSSALNVEAEPIPLDALASGEIICGLGAELVFVIPLFMWARRGAQRGARRLRAAISA